jgi:glycerophosphoryl diester phosphodiesterase
MKNNQIKQNFPFFKFIVLGAIFFSFIQSCDLKNYLKANNSKSKTSEAKMIQVIAHRGDWLNHPENSINSIESCISLGVDIVEIDVRQTKDKQLVLMHDETIDRTTNGSGRVEDWNLNELKQLYLKDKFGHLTSEKIPTLHEALKTSKNRIALKLDKTYRSFQLTYEIVKTADQLDQVFFKTHVPNEESSKIIPAELKIKLIPMLEFPMDSPEQFVKGHLKNPQVIGFEFILPEDDIPFIEKFEELNLKGKEIWVNSFWARFNGGHDDSKVDNDPEVYDWYI